MKLVRKIKVLIKNQEAAESKLALEIKKNKMLEVFNLNFTPMITLLEEHKKKLTSERDSESKYFLAIDAFRDFLRRIFYM